MFQMLENIIITLAFSYIISFVVLITLVKVCSGAVHKFLGADFYTFNLGKRVRIIATISLVISIILTIAMLIFL